MKLKLAKIFRSQRRAPELPPDVDYSEYTSVTMRSPAISQLTNALIRLSIWMQVRGQPLARQMNWHLIRGLGLLLALSFVLANVVSTYSTSLAFKLFSSGRKATIALENQNSGGAFRAAVAGTQQGSSVQALRDTIVKRNLFNSEGKLAPEGNPEDAFKKTADLNFTSVPCTTEKLPVEVLGTIYMGDPFRSLVILKEAKIPDADIYHAGNVIIDHEELEIYKVNQGYVEFRKGDIKICVDVTGRDKNPAATSLEEIAKPEATESIELSDAEIKALLGPEMARAMTEAKLIPEIQPGASTIQGFRLLAIVPGSIFDRLKLQNEDLIQEVNGISLKDPAQGIRLYEALQQQRDITINFTRKGDPMVRKVRVK